MNMETIGGMTIEQIKIFIDVAQTGIANGLSSPYEWYSDAIMNIPLPFGEKQAYYTDMSHHQVTDAFAAFFRGCGASDMETIALASYTDIDVINYFRSVY